MRRMNQRKESSLHERKTPHADPDPDAESDKSSEEIEDPPEWLLTQIGEEILSKGVLEGNRFAPLKQVVVEITVWRAMNAHYFSELAKHEAKIPTYQDMCGKIFDLSQKFHSLMVELYEEEGQRASREVLAVKSFFFRAMELFCFWSLLADDTLFVLEGVRLLADAGSILLAGLLYGNDRLRLLLWQSDDFKWALKNAIRKLQVDKETSFRIWPLYTLLCSLQGTQRTGFSIPHEVVMSFNGFKPEVGGGEEGGAAGGAGGVFGGGEERGDAGGEGRVFCREGEEGGVESKDDTGPIDVSHILRAAFWVAAEGHWSNQSPAKSLFERWASIAERFKMISLRENFTQAARRTFVGEEESADALELFKSAVSGVENDGPPNCPERARRLWDRLLAIECTLPNPAVAQYVSEHKDQFSAQMWRLREGARENDSDQYMLITGLLAWIAASRAVVPFDECKNLYAFLRLHPGIDLQSLSASNLFGFLEGLMTDGAVEMGLKRGDCDSYQPRRKVKRDVAPLPCTRCGGGVPTHMTCAGCKMVVYCGRECQKEDWKRKEGGRGHHKRCGLLKARVTDVLFANGSYNVRLKEGPDNFLDNLSAVLLWQIRQRKAWEAKRGAGV
uniref:MYND-type domain-containing protein n=1 Tax=Chromera velia CCMP2878 TaxID=1169474 RepID=A0A0G4I104_9ALVE|eukprot:Cvel_10053.t1-p1 / transcript=Cvel_10053.t1 / gene=Cvel_10053 / organism=Chromera_velia_CCMP2878 / gene_product=hypothetical protein / transcript_product=hypothetical protein / location=Cvel_scaffold598:35532-37376(+) / protein_length=615 / sequence_SO=supercontig / SO=protein_coding / is_pseudo=false